jgi:hypothetical protein
VGPARKRGIAAALCATIAAASLASAPGCAETDELSERLSKAQYLIELRAVVAEVRESLRVGERFLEVSSVEQLTRLVDRAVARYDQIVDRMESIEPPEEVADLHGRLTDAMVAAQGVLQDASASLQAGDLAALLALAGEVDGLAQDVGGLTVDYAERGYDLSPKGGTGGDGTGP